MAVYFQVLRGRRFSGTQPSGQLEPAEIGSISIFSAVPLGLPKTDHAFLKPQVIVPSIFAHEYPHKLWVKILVYAYAGGVVGARLAANMHFPGDVMAGGAMGWFVGDFVYGKRHNSQLDKPTITRKILDHLQISLGYPAEP